MSPVNTDELEYALLMARHTVSLTMSRPKNTRPPTTLTSRRAGRRRLNHEPAIKHDRGLCVPCSTRAGKG
jgi:hypothetical protein